MTLLRDKQACNPKTPQNIKSMYEAEIKQKKTDQGNFRKALRPLWETETTSQSAGAEGGYRRTHTLSENDDGFDVFDKPFQTLEVTECTQTFYNDHRNENCYQVSSPRGLALIVNVQFHEGSDVDRDNLKHLWKKLGFEVIVYNDESGLTAQQILDKVSWFAKESAHENYKCAVVCILSPGQSGFIYGTDGVKVDIDEIQQLFNHENCPALKNKPKLFFIEAYCGKPESGVTALGTFKDFLMAYPTPEGYKSWKNKEKGSWFIQAVVYIFAKYAATKCLQALLNMVNEIIQRKLSSTGKGAMAYHEYIMGEKTPDLPMEVYFFPGIKENWPEGAVMSQEHEERIRKHSDYIIRRMQPERVIRLLWAAGVLTREDKETIDALGTTTKKNEKTLDLLCDKPDTAYLEFIKALEESEQTHIAKFLK